MAIKQAWKTNDPGYPGKRYSGFWKDTSTGNHVVPTRYDTYVGNFSQSKKVGTRYWSAVDVPNLSSVYSTRGRVIETIPRARNRAWSDFVDNVRTGPASLGVALAEWPESLSMIANRAVRLRAGYRDLRRGDFRGFLRQFAIGSKRKHRNKVSNVANEASSLWLEYSFGWKPLTQDIYQGVNAMGEPVPGGPVSGSGFEAVSKDYSSRWVIQRLEGKGYVKYGADVFVSNPNLYLAQQLGLANPALVAWELVPFSFMIDWVFDVGTCLGAMTDLLGCDVSNRYCTGFIRGEGSYGDRGSSWGDTPFMNTGFQMMMERRTSFPYPVPNTSFHANIGTSMNRAANAVSLLGQILTK